jgi:Mrp family chromosome partitioning ATPase
VNRSAQRATVQGAVMQEMPKKEPTVEPPVQEEKDDTLIKAVPAQVETVVVDAPLGTNGTHADVAEPYPSDTTRGDAPTHVPPGDFVGLGGAQLRP